MIAQQVTAILEGESTPAMPGDSFGRLDRQMRTLAYVWDEYVNDGGRADTAAVNLEMQLIDLYQEREQAGGRSYLELTTTIEGLNAQLHSLYEDREGSTEECQVLRETVNNCEQQLAALYDERESTGFVSRFIGETDEGSAGRSVEDRATLRYGIVEANSMVDSLEQQVAALLEERDELSEMLVKSNEAAAEQVLKARSLITAVFDRALKA